MAVAPWVVSDELWSRIEPFLPTVERRFRYPGRKRLSDRQALHGILFVLYTGIAWRHLPAELGFGGGSTCHRWMDEWQRAGVWERLHEVLLAELRAAGEIEWSRAVADSSHLQAKKGRREKYKSSFPGIFYGPGRDRTCDLGIKSPYFWLPCFGSIEPFFGLFERFLAKGRILHITPRYVPRYVPHQSRIRAWPRNASCRSSTSNESVGAPTGASR
jgi:transposase